MRLDTLCVCAADLHRDFNRVELSTWDHSDLLHVPDSDALQRYRSADAQTSCVLEVRFQYQLAAEQPGVPAHQEDEQCQHQTGENDGKAYAQLRPAKLCLTRQFAPRDCD